MACTEYSSDLTSGQTFTESGHTSTLVVDNAFDDTLTTRWASTNAGDRWIQVEFSTAQKINRCRMYDSTTPGNMPTQVIIKASNTGDFTGEETTLFTSSESLTWSTYEWKEFDFDNDDSFTYYRIFTILNPVVGVNVYEVELMECTGEASEIEVDITDVAGIADSVDSFSLTDTIQDSAGLADAADAFNTNDELIDAIGVGDASDRYSEASFTLPDALGIADTSDGFNWTSWFRLNQDRAVIRYYCTLTGANDSLADLSIPISSFQARKRSGESTYLSVVVPGMALAESISDRLNGELVIDMAYLLDGVESLREEIIRVDLEQINPSIGPRNRSITLVGHKTVTYDARAASIQGANYKYENDGMLGFRFPQADPYLNPGDALTVVDTNDVFTVDYITYAISARGAKFMEVREG